MRARAGTAAALLSFWSSDWSLTVLLWLLVDNFSHCHSLLPSLGKARRSRCTLANHHLWRTRDCRNRRFVAVTTIFILVFLFMGGKAFSGQLCTLTCYDVGALLFLGFFVVLMFDKFSAPDRLLGIESKGRLRLTYLWDFSGLSRMTFVELLQ